MAESTITLSDTTFDEEIKGASTPVLVDFWAEWCGPCKVIAPILDEIASEQEGRLTVAKLNVDDAPDIARRFGVMSIPTTMAALLPMLEEGGFIHRTLSLVELFVIWQFFLLAVGTGALFKRRTSPIATTFYSLYAVIAIAAGFFLSRLGG